MRILQHETVAGDSLVGFRLVGYIEVSGNYGRLVAYDFFYFLNNQQSAFLRASVPTWSKCVLMAIKIFPLVLSFSLAQVAIRVQAPSHPMKPTLSGYCDSQKVLLSNNSKRSFYRTEGHIRLVSFRLLVPRRLRHILVDGLSGLQAGGAGLPAYLQCPDFVP